MRAQPFDWLAFVEVLNTLLAVATGVQVVENQEVDTSTILGFVSNVGPGEGVEKHLHFAFYEGENRRQAGQGLLTSFDAVVVPVPPMFANGFESGDTFAWSSAVQ